MNNITIIGNITGDIEIKTYKEDKKWAKFFVAVNERDDKVNYFPITVFGKQAENCENYLKKGSKVGIMGRIDIDIVEKDGEKKTYINLIASSIEFLNFTKKGNKS